MNLIGKLQPVIIITAALRELLLYILFLSIDLKQIKKFFTNVRFTASAVIINFVFMPLFGHLLGKVFFPGSLDIRIGPLIELPLLSVISGILNRWNSEE